MTDTTTRRTSVSFFLAGLALAVAVVAGAFGIWRFVEMERGRDLRGWQSRLGVVADSRTAAVSHWVDAQFGELTGLAENPALQIYMTELAQAGGDQRAVTDQAAQAAYLRILLTVTASRGGFVAAAASDESPGKGKRIGVAGLALLDAARRPVAATVGMPPLDGRLLDFVTHAKPGARAILDMELDSSGRPQMAFLVPIFAVQGSAAESDQVGSVLGVKEVGDDLFPLLVQPGTMEPSLEALLVRERGAAIDYLSPTMDGTLPLRRALAGTTPDLAEAYGIANPGGFALLRDYRDREVLVTSRAIAGTPWTLIEKIDRNDALSESDTRRSWLVTGFGLLAALIATALWASWRHGASRRAAAAMARYRDLAARHEQQERFLRLVTDSQPTAMFLLDDGGSLRFANRRVADLVGVPAGDLIGKRSASVFGPSPAHRYDSLRGKAKALGRPIVAVERLGVNGTSRVVQATVVPVAETSAQLGGTLIVEEDITEAVTERERRERTLRHVVQGLLAAVDRRDPHAANHSAFTGSLSRAIAEDMALSPSDIEAAEFAGCLMNLGKILVPEAILTRSGPLSPDERQQVRDSMLASVDFVAGIEFDGPVAETLRQTGERWDGTGQPRGLKGEEILLPARIVTVANAYVAMVSPRAHRPGLDTDAALAVLFDGIGSAYDRRVVAAMANYLENKIVRIEQGSHETGHSHAPI
ncbi:MAG: HD domain-containing phosphohydrolase [Alphaproteobacteria bacterium]